MTLPDGTAASIVSSDLVTVDQSASPRQALKLLIENSIHVLPVLEQIRLKWIADGYDLSEAIQQCRDQVSAKSDAEKT